MSKNMIPKMPYLCQRRKIVFLSREDDQTDPVIFEPEPKPAPEPEPPKENPLPLLPKDSQMTLAQALSIAALVIDFEMAFPHVTPAPEDWQEEIVQARQLIRSVLWSIAPLKGILQ